MATKSKRSIVTGLTVNEEVMAQLIADGHSNYDAYIQSHGAGKASKKTNTERASRVSGRYNIATRVEILRAAQAERSAINRDWIVDKLKTIIEVGVERSIMVEVKTTRPQTGEYSEIIEERSLEKLVDSSGANAALDKMIKMGGLYAAEKFEGEVKTKGKFILNLQPRTDQDQKSG